MTDDTAFDLISGSANLFAYGLWAERLSEI
jgi:hypothetical protein